MKRGSTNENKALLSARGRIQEESAENFTTSIVRECKIFVAEAVPYTASTAIVAVGNFVSAKLLADLGQEELAASGLITSAQLLLQGFLFSPLFVVGMYSGRAFGENDLDKVNASIQQGMAAALIYSVPMVTLSKFMKGIYIAAGQEVTIANLTQDFFDGYIYGCWADVALVATQQHAVALKEQNAVFISSLLQKTISIGLSYWLMFGSPQLGALGLGYAYSSTSIAAFAGLNLYLIYKQKLNLSDIFSLTKFRLRWPVLKELLKLGIPIGVHVGSELAALSGLLVMSGALSSGDLVSAELVFQWTGLILVPIIGSSQATGVLASRAIGSRNPIQARRSANTGYLLGAILPLASSLAMVTAWKPLTSVFIDTADPANAAILRGSWELFIINAVTQPLDFVRNNSIGNLRALFDTFVPMCINVGAAATNLGLSYLAGFTLGFGNEGIYFVRSASIAVAAAILAIRWYKKINKEVKDQRIENNAETELTRPLVSSELDSSATLLTRRGLFAESSKRASLEGTDNESISSQTSSDGFLTRIISSARNMSCVIS